MMVHRYDNDPNYNDYMRQDHIRSHGLVALRCARQIWDLSLEGKKKSKAGLYAQLTSHLTSSFGLLTTFSNL